MKLTIQEVFLKLKLANKFRLCLGYQTSRGRQRLRSEGSKGAVQQDFCDLLHGNREQLYGDEKPGQEVGSTGEGHDFIVMFRDWMKSSLSSFPRPGSQTHIT